MQNAKDIPVLPVSDPTLTATPPIPADLRDFPIELTDNARTVLRKRYLRRGADGKPSETEQGMFWRVAYNIALAEIEHGGTTDTVEQIARRFFHLLVALQFFPNSPTFTGAGTPLGQLAACFVLAIDDDMGRTETGIFQTLRNAALIQQTGGGNGFAFSRLRPKGGLVRSSNGQATGPVGFLRVYDQAFGEIAQGGCLTPDTLVFTDRGLLRLDEIVTQKRPGWYAHTFTVPTDEGDRQSVQGYNNGVAPVFKVTTEAGMELTGTANHKVKVMTASGPEWRMIGDLQPGDQVMMKLGQHRGQLQKLFHPTRTHGNQIMPNFPAVLDQDLAFFLGYLIGDGFIASGNDDHRIGITVAHTSYLIDEMPRLIQKLFGTAVTIHTQQKANDASLTYVIDNRALKDFLTLNGLSKIASTSAQIPRLIRQSSPEIAGAFLSGLFEADGAISHGYPALCSTSEKLIREVATLLIGLGLPIRLDQPPIGEGHYGQAPLWRLRIQSFAGLEVWRNLISCNPRSRFQVCHEFQPDLMRESSYPLPEAEYWIGSALEAIRLPQIDKRGRGTGHNFRSTSPELHRQLLRYVRGERQLTLSGYTQLSAQHTAFAEHARPVNDLWFSPVTAITSVGESVTLDLEVEDNHTYIANGMVVHNSRRGANMAVLQVDHPDVRDFITCKTDESKITNFNISVGITDEFMRQVEADGMYDLINPQDNTVWETVRAREIYDLIVKYAHHNGEPGVLFLDTANRHNPVPHLYKLESTNPCGEQWLGPFENCCLGSINVAKIATADGQVDWEKFRDLIETSTRFLDDVVTANKYVPAVPQLKEAAHRVRRIGLGIMGLADLMYSLGVRYGSEEGQEFSAQISEFLRYHAMKTSVALAQERGAFPAIKGSIYDPENLTWQPPTPTFPYTRSWNRPAIDWASIVSGIKQYGIRNGAQTTVAPTGTIATVSGCEGYGCEPVFALAYVRHVNDQGKDLQLQYTSPLFEKALRNSGLTAPQIDAIIAEVNQKGSCQDIAGLPEALRHTFVVSSDVSLEEHVRMQAAMQAFVDNAISKTLNAPEGTTEAEVAAAYMLGWKLGCKGMTVYVTGSRDKVVLETHATAQTKQLEATAPESTVVATPEPLTVAAAPTAVPHVIEEMPALVKPVKKSRPHKLIGRTYRVETPLGKTYVTINENGEGLGYPFEIFTHTSKAGSDTAAVSEAIGRLISLMLRLRAPLSGPRDRLKEIAHELDGIGGGRPTGFGAARVRSLPDGIARVLQEYLDETEDNLGAPTELPPKPIAAAPQATLPSGQVNAPTATSAAKSAGIPSARIIGDLCPECGEATLVNEEGCRKCYTCGYSEC